MIAHLMEKIVRQMPSIGVRRLVNVTWHAIGLYFTYYLAFELRFDGSVPLSHEQVFWHTLPLLLTVGLLVFAVFRQYSGLWSYFSIDDLVQTGLSLAAAIVLFALAIFAVHGWSAEGYPRSILVLEFLLMGLWMAGGRLAVRYAKQHRSLPAAGRERVLIVGKLNDADLVIRALRGAGETEFVGLATDEKDQGNQKLHDVNVYALSDNAGVIASQTGANCVMVLPPFNGPNRMREIVESCGSARAGCVFRTIPSLADLASGRLSASSVRNVDIEDLIGRGSTQLDHAEVRRFIKGKKVMVSGAGGSIGSELCRQVAGYEPELIVLFEYSEYALYTITGDIQRLYPNLKLIACAGDIRHPKEVESAVEDAGGIDIVYHCAAYKHVPLMEENVPACFRTNVLGTARLAQTAVKMGVDRFVMISSDKAVRPTSMMGATKRIAEQVIAELSHGKTTFVSVRFGNVLESSGSVIPLFKKQIAAGGPVTVTTPEVRRFFMTVSEAVDLVLLAGTVGRNGEVMVLEMGESIKIIDLAKRLIELSGFVPGKDIAIKYIGLRPGEKEFEEVMTEDENAVRTAHDKIWVLKKNGVAGKEGPESSLFRNGLGRIEDLVLKNDFEGLRKLAAEYVPDNYFNGDKRGQKNRVTESKQTT